MSDQHGVDLDALGRWMNAVGLPPGSISGTELLAGGTQNILLRFERGGESYVLRRPPLHKRANSDETMRREAKVLGALADSTVPHPALRAACPDETVLGAAFYLMAPIDGVNLTLGLPDSYASDALWRRQVGLDVAAAAAAIGNVDHVAAGLEGLGRSERFLERQVERWKAQLDSYGGFDGYPGPAIPGVEKVAEWLDRNCPTSWRAGLMHGDFHLANVLAASDTPRIAAVIDWELCTIGDPLLDLGWLLATWPEDAEPTVPDFAIGPWDGFPTREELTAHYADRSDRDLSALPWYEVLACFKLGILLEGTHARACAGQADKATGDRLHATTLRLFDRARRRIVAA